MRVCHCTGYLNNPGGRCCRDLPGAPQTGTHTFTPNPSPTEEQIRRWIREEIERNK